MRARFIFCLAASIAASSSAQQSKLPVLHPRFTTLGTVTDTTVNWQAAASPNGRFVAYTSSYGDLRLYDVRTKRSSVLSSAMKWTGWPAWSQNSDVIVFTYWNEAGEPSVYAVDVDPNTGAARGTPRRITVNGGTNPSPSPDGKLIAYNRTDDDNKPVTDLLLVPATGGAPRTVVTAWLAAPTRWSPDGRWIYYVLEGPQSAFADGSAEFDTYRARTDGSSPQRIARSAGTWPGLTNDGRFLVTRDGTVNDTLRHAIVADASGKQIATFTSSPGDEVGHWVDNYRFLTVRDDQRKVLRIATMNGTSRDFPAAGGSVETAAFSPDGKRIAVFQRNGSRTTLIVTNADGTERHVASLRNMIGDAQPKWSPNSRYIAYMKSLDAPRTVNVYDVTTNAERSIVSFDKRMGRDLHWRSNSKSLLYLRFDKFGPTPELTEFDVHEVTIDGRDRAVRIIPREMRSTGNVPQEIRLGDTLAISVGSAGVWAIPYSDAPAHLVKRETTTRTTFTPDGNALVHGLETNPGGRTFRTLEVLRLDGTVIRNIQLPFIGYTTVNDRHIVLSRDGREAILVGRDSEDAATGKIYRVPLDGSAPRPIVSLPSAIGSQIDVAPDGRSILYTVLGPEASSFVLVDLTSELSRLSPHR